MASMPAGDIRDEGAQLERMGAQMQRMNETLIRLELKVMPREYIDGQDEKRVHKDDYAKDLSIINERFTRIETHWTKLLPWLATAVSAAGFGHMMRWF